MLAKASQIWACALTRWRFGLRLCLLLLFILGLQHIAMACPTCKAGLGAHDPAHGDLVGAYMWSILFMMAMPFTLLGSFSGYCYWLVRKARASAQTAASGLQNEAAARVDSEVESEPLRV